LNRELSKPPSWHGICTIFYASVFREPDPGLDFPKEEHMKKTVAVIFFCLLAGILSAKNIYYKDVSFGLMPGLKLGLDYLVKVSLTPHLIIPMDAYWVCLVYCQPEFSFVDMGLNLGLCLGEVDRYVMEWDDQVHSLIKNPADYYFWSLAFCTKFKNYISRGFSADNLLYGVKFEVTFLMLINMEFIYYFNGTTDMERYSLGIGVGF
jgi:hypothetical protein